MKIQMDSEATTSQMPRCMAQIEFIQAITTFQISIPTTTPPTQTLGETITMPTPLITLRIQITSLLESNI
jgi:hypothetical protein